MLDTSKDLFYLILTFCVFGFTVFLCVALYYVISILKQFDQVIESARTKVGQITNLVGLIRNKIFSKGAKTIFDYMVGSKETKESKSKRKTK